MNAENTKNLKRIVTHNGNFHTDEVFACAVLSILNDGAVEILRSRDPEVWATGDYVVDVGGVYDEAKGRFDHHQIGGAGTHENGIPYSSIGLVWKAYGEKITRSAYAARVINERFVQPVDAGDNGIGTFTIKDQVAPVLIHDAISAFRPAWNDERTEDEGFLEAFEMAKKILTREIILARAEEEGKRHAEEAYTHMEDKRIVILEDHYPWYEALGSKPEPLYVVKPDRANAGRWKVEAVRSDVHAFKNRKDLPEAWAGERDQELAIASGVPDAIFCHSKRFIAVAGSKEGALALARKAVEA
jgi:uncharacterized UPF0160 family protein